MPPFSQEKFTPISPPEEMPSTSQKPAANDETFGEEDSPTVMTAEGIAARIKALKWLLTPGNGATKEAVEMFKAELEQLEQRQ